MCGIDISHYFENEAPATVPPLDRRSRIGMSRLKNKDHSKEVVLANLVWSLMSIQAAIIRASGSGHALA